MLFKHNRIQMQVNEKRRLIHDLKVLSWPADIAGATTCKASNLQDPLLLQRLTESTAFEATAESTAFPATR
jgi:hypothetical protein